MKEIKSNHIPLPILGTTFFTFLLSCSTMAMELDTELDSKNPSNSEKIKKFARRPRAENAKSSDANYMRKPSSLNSVPSSSGESISGNSPSIPIPCTHNSPSIPTSSSNSNKVKFNLNLNTLHKKSQSTPTSPSSSPRAPESRIPLRKTSSSNPTSLNGSPKNSDSKLHLRKTSVSNSISPSSSPRTFEEEITSRVRTLSSQLSPKLTSEAGHLPRRTSAPDMNASLSSGSDISKENRPTYPRQKVTKSKTVSAFVPSHSQKKSLTGSLTDMRLPSPTRRSPRPSLSEGNAHTLSKDRTIWTPRFLQELNKTLVDVLDNVMNKPSIPWCLENLQHLRWKFYCSIKEPTLISNFNENINFRDINYTYDIKPEELLDVFWNTDIRKHLDDEKLIQKIEVDDLELIANSIEFIINNSNINPEKLSLYKYAILSYQKLFENPATKNKEQYHYKIAKYATLSEKYGDGYSHFLKCIQFNHLNMQNDFWWVSLMKTHFLSELENKETKHNFDKAMCYFQIATLTNDMDNTVIKPKKLRFFKTPPTLTHTLNPDEMIFFYDQVLYCNFFGNQKMEVDAEAINLFLKNDKIHNETNISDDVFTLEIENNDENFKNSHLIDYMQKKLTGSRTIFLENAPTKEDQNKLNPDDLIFFYEYLPFFQVHGKDRVRLQFDDSSSQGLTESSFVDIIETLQTGSNLTDEQQQHLIGCISSDNYNLVSKIDMDHNKEPTPEATHLFLKSAELYYQSKNPWDHLTKWRPNVLYFMAKRAMELALGEEETDFSDDFFGNFYYDSMGYFIENEKLYAKYYPDIIDQTLLFPASTTIEGGKHIAKVGKLAFALGEDNKARELYSKAADTFHEIEYPANFYKRVDKQIGHGGIKDAIEDDMLVFIIRAAIKRGDEVKNREFIKDLSFHLIRDRKYLSENIKFDNGIDLFDLIIEYFYNNKMYVTSQRFISLFINYTLKPIFTKEELHNIKEGELGIFYEGNKLYFKTQNKGENKEMPIIRSDDTIDDISVKSFGTILQSMKIQIKNDMTLRPLAKEVLQHALLKGYILPSKKNWTSRMEDFIANYLSTQQRKKNFFIKFSSNVRAIIENQKNPQNQKAAELLKQLKSESFFSEEQWATATKIQTAILEQYYYSLTNLVGTKSNAYQECEEAEYEEKVFELLFQK